MKHKKTNKEIYFHCFSGDTCVARYSADGEWYRAKVEKILPDHEVAVLFIDYGNREVVKYAKCAALPGIPAATETPFAKEYALACVTLSSDVSLHYSVTQ